MEIDLTVSVPEFDDNGWDYNQSVSRCKNLYSVMRHGGTKLIVELLHAHEMLVKKEIPGKTWGGYCEELGISTRTIINWFNKYHLTFTQISGPKEEPKFLGSDKPLRTKTKPEVKIKLKEVKEKIRDNEVSDKDIKEVMDTVADKIGKIKPETEEDFEDALIIRAALPIIITHASRLGIDINKVLELGTDKQSNKKGKEDEKVIDIETIKNVGPGS